MDCRELISAIKDRFPAFCEQQVSQDHSDEIVIKVGPQFFRETCLILHNIFPSPVMIFFALDERAKTGKFTVNCVFVNFKNSQWITVSLDINAENPCFGSLAKDIYSAALFEREIFEMFGIQAIGNPDLRRLNLHDEVWPKNSFPLRKDFIAAPKENLGEYKFSRVEGSGIFEVPVGPVHAGIIGPGHFRFSAAGEPIVNLEIRLGFTHRGVEKLFEGRDLSQGLNFAEHICGDCAFAYSLTFAQAAEKILKIAIPAQAAYLRGIFLELERMYNHVSSIAGMALDVGFSYPAAYAAVIKEALLQLNQNLTGSRYLKNINTIGGVFKGIDSQMKSALLAALDKIGPDFDELIKILDASVSFMDRVDATGVLKRKTAMDLGVVGLAARACGIPTDLRKYFPGVYREADFKMSTSQSGDCLARFRVRVAEFRESMRLIKFFLNRVSDGERIKLPQQMREGSALGYCEGFRGPVLYWLKIDKEGRIERCKIVDASFHNWQGLSYAVLGNIIPDFPLCNKSFDLSYAGNDL